MTGRMDGVAAQVTSWAHRHGRLDVQVSFMSYDDSLLADAAHELQQQFRDGMYQPGNYPVASAGELRRAYEMIETARIEAAASKAALEHVKQQAEKARRSIPAAPLRIGDAERDKAISILSGHFAAGRLWQNEFSERSEKAVSAETQQQLSALLADLPEPEPEPALGARHHWMWLDTVMTAGMLMCALLCFILAAIT